MGVSDLLASVSNAAAAAAPAEAEADDIESNEEIAAEGESDVASELADEAAAQEEGDEKADAAKEAEAAALRQADYTKKTQALAEERKRLHAEVEEERANFRETAENLEEIKGWLNGLHDPETAEYQLRRYFPQMVDALRNKWIAESGEESQMTERERAAIARARQLEIEARGRTEDEALQKKRWEAKQQAQKTLEFKQKFDAWLPSAAKAAGLDLDEDTFRLIKNELRGPEYQKILWTENVIATAAKAVAKAMKRGEVKPEPPKPPPSIKGTGQKAPASASKAKAPKAKLSSEDYFRQLREKYGGR